MNQSHVKRKDRKMDTDHDPTDTHEAALERLVAQLNKPEVKEWLALRKEAGARIDPTTAVVFWECGNPIDPYGVCDDLGGWIGRVYFARSPESDVWVEFGDLPEPTRTAIWQRPKQIWEDEIF